MVLLYFVTKLCRPACRNRHCVTVYVHLVRTYSTVQYCTSNVMLYTVYRFVLSSGVPISECSSMKPVHPTDSECGHDGNYT